MTVEELVERQVRNPDQLAGKTIKTVEEDGNRVVLVFTDGTFAIIDPNPEDDGCGMCLDAWWNRNQAFVEKLTKLLDR